jgi:orotidine-5'-phosphate decarboxylase
VSKVSDPRIIVALDVPDRAQAQGIADRLDPGHCRLKVGKELFTRSGPAMVEWLVERGFDVFLDLKFHDIPNTVYRACKAAASLRVWMLTLHACGGREMLTAAAEAVKEFPRRPLLAGVTVLTSMSAGGLLDVGVTDDVATQVRRLGKLALDAGVDGLVCSALETEMLRREFGSAPVLVTPGIRPAGIASDDQDRVASPAQAIRAGSSYLVIGRPVIRADDPLQALRDIEAEVTAALMQQRAADQSK